jgi:hypothetical protein
MEQYFGGRPNELAAVASEGGAVKFAATIRQENSRNCRTTFQK